MGKKKSRPKKPKPLLFLQGILHLQNSFVQPTQESGLLSTVGGGLSEQGLVLAPNYGYGIPASALEATNNKKEKEEDEETTSASIPETPPVESPDASNQGTGNSGNSES